MLVGLLMLVVAAGVTFAAGVFAARFTARRSGIPDFRLGITSAPETRWKLVWIRSASVAGAFFTCFFLAFAAAFMLGTFRPTMIVTVHEGPAREAGVKDGDRIVALDGKPCPTFEALRSELRSGSGPRALAVERNSERVTLVVTPTAEHRIGVEERREHGPASAGEAFTRAFRTTMVPVSSLVSAFSLATGSDKPAMMGPVGLVRETSRQKHAGLGTTLQAGAIYASFVWPVVLLVHILDAFLSRGRSRTGGNA